MVAILYSLCYNAYYNLKKVIKMANPEKEFTEIYGISREQAGALADADDTKLAVRGLMRELGVDGDPAEGAVGLIAATEDMPADYVMLDAHDAGTRIAPEFAVARGLAPAEEAQPNVEVGEDGKRIRITSRLGDPGHAAKEAKWLAAHPGAKVEAETEPLTIDELISRLKDPEASVNPDVEVISQAVGKIGEYLAQADVTTPEYGNVLYGMNSIAGALADRQEQVAPEVVTRKLEADGILHDTLFHAALGINYGTKSEKGAAVGHNIADEGIDFVKAIGEDPKGNRTPRLRAFDVLRTATDEVFKGDLDKPGVKEELRNIADGTAKLVDAMLAYAGRDESIDTGSVGVFNQETQRLDTVQGNIPMYKDYIARHLAASLEDIQSQEATQSA